MTPGAKIFLVIASAGALLGGLAIVAAKSAKAATKNPDQLPPHDEAPPDVIVPPLAEQPPAPQGPATVPLPPIVSQPPIVPVPPILAPPATAQGPATVPLPPILSGPPLPLPILQPSTPATPPAPLPGTVSPPVSALPPAVTVPLPTGPVTVPLPPLVVTASPPASVPSSAPPAPVTAVPADVAQMVATLLAAEQAAGWNHLDPSVAVFQGAHGLKVDSKFGPKSALTVAGFLTTIPIIRYWPRGSQLKAALSDYRASLLKLASETTDPQRAAALRFAAMREQGQSFGQKESKAPALPVSAQVQLQKVA